ncbi:DUF433 domain-containing protein [Dyadobacter aurulentus]|uniref:DUF433 domain-containing protein n=1 Tax=Dyadobacter sp. UC 10 TaxID=2605428 RepID=UPI0011F2CD45|nr:DUF433 domain-containing protein [Dyadobacter sp. UC 10]KAA0990741.1 DUF433 domain-containing protein [Dyadobacter sp. UC 10]
MNYRDYISADYRVMLGKPVLTGTRLSVELILRKLAEGATFDDLTRMYPDLPTGSIQAILQYAADLVENE